MSVQNNDKRPALKSVAQEAPKMPNAGAQGSQDDDLEKLMNQIDELQKDMNTSVAPKAKPVATALDPMVPAEVAPSNPATEVKNSEPELSSQVEGGDQNEPWLEETLAQLKSTEINDSRGALEEETQEMSEMASEEVEEAISDGDEQNGQLSMKIQGKMKIKLNYGLGQFVSIDFNDSSLRIQFANGMEMKIPTVTKISKKAA